MRPTSFRGVLIAAFVSLAGAARAQGSAAPAGPAPATAPVPALTPAPDAPAPDAPAPDAPAPDAPAAGTPAPAPAAPTDGGLLVTGHRPFSAASDQTVRNRDFMSYPRRTASDLLRFVPGLHITQHTGGAKAHQIFLRGFDAEHG